MLLKPDDTCWRVEEAGRLAILMENGDYFRALAAALPLARRSILLLGWNFDPRTRLAPEGRNHDHGQELGHLLRRLARARPALSIRLLVWRSPLLIAFSQGFFPQRARSWFEHQPIEFRLDRARPIGACHHQKVVVIDDALAFCGGGDVSVDRFDTAEHLDDDPRRCTPTGRISPPRHEVMTLMNGPAARALGDLARQRWLEATGDVVEAVPEGAQPWPESVEPHFTKVPVGIARTEPAWRKAAGIRENERLHLDSISSAKTLIYLENQYFTSPLVGAALASRLEEPDGPEVVVVSTAHAPSWFDHFAMDGARQALVERLKQADIHGRLSIWTPVTDTGRTIIVHSKVTVIDDRLLRVGSTNLNNRSAGFDTECDVAVEAGWEGDETSLTIHRFRSQLVAHFLGVETEDVERAHGEYDRLGPAIEALNHKGRMKPLGTRPASRLAKWIAEYQLGDPITPADAWRPWRRGRLSRLFKRTVAHAAGAAETLAETEAELETMSKSITSGR